MANVLWDKFQDDSEYYAYDVLAENSDEEPTDQKAPLATDESVTEMTVTEAGSYWLTGYDPLNDKPGIAYPNCKTLDASESTGDMLLAGNLQDNLIIAGAGKATLWGGIYGDDTLTGGAERDIFWYGEGDGDDEVDNFTAGAAETADVLNIYGGKVRYVTRSGGTLTIGMEDRKSLTVNTDSEAAGVILYQKEGESSIKGACIGESNEDNSFYYLESVSYYQGGSYSDVLVLPSGNDPKIVWLDGGKDTLYSDIDIIDGSESSGADQLAGSDAEESITGGRGAASLWGGRGSADDTLRAGTGENVLYYGYAEGNDIIQNTHHNDTVRLFDIAPSQLPVADISGSTIRFVTTAGESLLVYGEAATFVLGDGSVWKPDRVKDTWTVVSQK